MAGTAVDAGKLFLAGVLAKIPNAEARAQVEAVFNDAANADALVVVGAGALAQSDINRKYTEIKAKEDTLAEDYEKLNGWYAANKDKLTEYDRLKATPVDPNAPRVPVVPPVLDPSKYLSREDFDKGMNDAQMQAANYLGLQNVLTLQHYKDFGTVLDTRELLADRNLGKQKPDGGIYGLIDAYQTKFSTQLSERDKTLEEARINKLADERVAEKMKGMPNLPFPLKSSPSALDLLEPGATHKPEDYTAAAAAEEYNRLQQARG